NTPGRGDSCSDGRQGRRRPVSSFRLSGCRFLPVGDMSWLSRIVYAIVGVCGLYLISFYMHLGSREEST
ncbi:MAG: DUF378 domain-containing protein, partial [Lachnospiraceae bacterium]|nr:DUF378 domain-containing protein [Lachnospiraceae bacterium]